MTEPVEVYPNVEPTVDKLFRVAEAMTSLIPCGQQVLHSLITPPVQARTKSWMESVEVRLKELSNAGEIDFQKITNSPQFSALTLRAIQNAAISSQDEKLHYLKNFVVNLARVPSVSEDELYILLDILGEFTPSHVKALMFYAYPERFSTQIGSIPTGAPPQNLSQGRELYVVFETGDPEYWQTIFLGVSGRHLVTSHTAVVKVSAILEREITGRSTQFGMKFLKMIEE